MSIIISVMSRCFRPLAGFWFLNDLKDELKALAKEQFPSPCGVLVLKYVLSRMLDNLFTVFPSPCGVLVLKSLHTGVDAQGNPLVSVPLRGSGS